MNQPISQSVSQCVLVSNPFVKRSIMFKCVALLTGEIRGRGGFAERELLLSDAGGHPCVADVLSDGQERPEHRHRRSKWRWKVHHCPTHRTVLRYHLRDSGKNSDLSNVCVRLLNSSSRFNLCPLSMPSHSH